MRLSEKLTISVNCGLKKFCSTGQGTPTNEGDLEKEHLGIDAINTYLM
jgi:hypothetical protein